MRNKILIPGLFVFIFFSSFTFQIFRTTLKVVVRNGLGNLEEGVKVKLFKNSEDYNADKNALQTGSTDKKGVIYFDDLEPAAYYISAEKGDKNNYGAGEKTDTLEAKHINKVTIIISE